VRNRCRFLWSLLLFKDLCLVITGQS
jgi:hypothetical protein